MSSLLQISDTHFGTEQAAVCRALLQLHVAEKPEVVVLSGDITQRARRSQFAAARRFVEQLRPSHLLAIPGNHDIPLFNPFARLLSPYANYRREFGDELEPKLDTESLLVVCVNTTRAARHTDGEVSDKQIDRVCQQLRTASSQQLRIVVTHQPVHVIRDSDIKNLLHGREQAVRAWSEAGADLIMGGHIHLAYVRPLSDCFKNLPRRLWSVQAGTAVSSRIRNNEPNSINLVRYPVEEPGVCLVERWNFHAASAAFQLGETQHIELDR